MFMSEMNMRDTITVSEMKGGHMIMRKFFLGLVLLSSMFMAAASAVATGEPASETANPKDDARAMLMRTGDALSKAGQFSVTIRVGYDVLQESGQKIEFGETRKVTLARPDRFRVEIEQSDGDKMLTVFDGKDITVLSDKDKVYASAPRPGNVDGAILYLLNDLKVRMPLALLFVKKLPEELGSRVRAVDIVGKSILADVPCTHLAARTDEVDFQVWIPTEGEPLPQRIVITYKNEDGQPQFWANFSDWNLSPNAPESLFVFTPPEGAERIPFLAQVETVKPDVQKIKKGGKK